MAPQLSSGATVGGFRIESLLARGAMAEVYRARGEAGQPVAVKLLDPALAHDERFRQRFTRESELAATLDHPNIVATFDSGEEDGRLFLALESESRASARPAAEPFSTGARRRSTCPAREARSS